jgi:hypothetical protein
MASILKMHRPFPTFTEARTHLQLEEMEIEDRPPSPPSALVATAPLPVAPGTAAPPRPGTPTPPSARPPGASSTPNPGSGGQRNDRRRGRGGRGGPPAPTGGTPLGLHPSYTHPWAGAIQMWPYNRFGRPPIDPSAFTAIPQFGGNFCSNLDGAYGPHLLSTGEPHLHHRPIRRPRHHPGPRPGTLPTGGRGIRTPWRTRSTP